MPESLKCNKTEIKVKIHSNHQCINRLFFFIEFKSTHHTPHANNTNEDKKRDIFFLYFNTNGGGGQT